MIFKDLTECFFISNIEYKILILQRLSLVFFSICRGEGDLTKWLEWRTCMGSGFPPCHKWICKQQYSTTSVDSQLVSSSPPTHSLPRAVLPSFKSPWPLIWTLFAGFTRAMRLKQRFRLWAAIGRSIFTFLFSQGSLAFTRSTLTKNEKGIEIRRGINLKKPI